MLMAGEGIFARSTLELSLESLTARWLRVFALHQRRFARRRESAATNRHHEVRGVPATTDEGCAPPIVIGGGGAAGGGGFGGSIHSAKMLPRLPGSVNGLFVLIF